MGKKGSLMLVILIGLFFLFSADSFASVVITPADSAVGGDMTLNFWNLRGPHRDFQGQVTISTTAGDDDTTVARKIYQACTTAGYVVSYTSGHDSVVVNSISGKDIWGVRSVAGTKSYFGSTGGIGFTVRAPRPPGAKAVLFTLTGTANGDGIVQFGVADAPELDVFTQSPPNGKTAEAIIDDADAFFAGDGYGTWQPTPTFLVVYAKRAIQHNSRIVTDTGLQKLVRGFESGLLSDDWDLGITQPIPTLSEWGMIGLAILIIVSGIWMLRRRKRLSLERRATD